MSEKESDKGDRQHPEITGRVMSEMRAGVLRRDVSRALLADGDQTIAGGVPAVAFPTTVLSGGDHENK